jgi:uncharacterized protein
MTPDPAVWVLHDGKAGMASQALGLAEAPGFPLIDKRLAIRFLWSHLPRHMGLWASHAVEGTGAQLAPLWPDPVIACGGNAAAPALTIRRSKRGRKIAAQIQDPEIGHGEFDPWTYPVRDDTTRAGAALRALVLRWLGQRSPG